MTASVAQAQENGKKSKDRSPAYPFISLKTAIDRAKEFHKEETRAAAPVSVAVKHWGYGEKSSGGIQTIAALKSYGLLADTGSGAGRKVQLSDLGLRIVMDERTVSPDRDILIKRAALMPKIHAKLWKQYGTSLPSEENLRYQLRVEMKFNDNAVGDFIREYRDTISFAKLSDSDTIPQVGGDIENETPDPGEQAMQNQQLTVAASTGQSGSASQVPKGLPLAGKPVGASIPVTKNCSVSILATGEVTQKGLDQLISYINLIKGSFPEDDSGAAN
jgi:hypothetical protein